MRCATNTEKKKKKVKNEHTNEHERRMKHIHAHGKVEKRMVGSYGRYHVCGAENDVSTCKSIFGRTPWPHAPHNKNMEELLIFDQFGIGKFCCNDVSRQTGKMG